MQKMVKRWSDSAASEGVQSSSLICTENLSPGGALEVAFLRHQAEIQSANALLRKGFRNASASFYLGTGRAPNTGSV